MKKFLSVLLVMVFVFAMVGCDTSSFSSESNDSSKVSSIATEENDNMTTGQKNALRKAESYLDTMAFSREGLIEQLEFEGYSNEDATFAVDNCGADWKEQAAKKAESYLDTMAFSRDGLIEQLEYEGFTNEEAVYGVTANGY